MAVICLLPHKKIIYISILFFTFMDVLFVLLFFTVVDLSNAFFSYDNRSFEKRKRGVNGGFKSLNIANTIQHYLQFSKKSKSFLLTQQPGVLVARCLVLNLSIFVFAIANTQLL